MNSTVTIEFLVDFEFNYSLGIAINTSGTITTNTWTWVGSRSAGFEVTTGTPTATAGEITASNFKTAYDLDLPTYTTIVTSNSIEITAPDTTISFSRVKVLDENLDDSLILGTDYNVTFSNYVEPVDTSNIELALTRSPHYVNIPYNISTTTATSVNLFVYDGDLDTPPPTPNYTLTSTRPTIDFSEANINLSNLINDSLDPVPNIDITNASQIVDSLNRSVKWIKYIASYTDSQEVIAEIQGTFAGLYGYGLYLEGVNPTQNGTDFLTDVTRRKVSRDGIVLLPYLNNGNITELTVSTESNQINDTLSVTPSNESTDFVQYVCIDVSQAITDLILTIEDNRGNQYVYDILDECRYNPKQIVFLNRYGAFETLTLFKKQTTSIEIQKENFTNSYITNGIYDTSIHQIKDINIQAKKPITLNSGYIKETENELYEQMLLSDKVYFYENNQLVPVTPKNRNLEFKTRLNDKLVSYTIDFDYAFNTIQNV